MINKYCLYHTYNIYLFLKLKIAFKKLIKFLIPYFQATICPIEQSTVKTRP
jgi:hypothetical protein